MLKKEIDSLIKLLDDPDEEIFIQVKEKLYDEGIPVIKKLEKTWESTNDLLVQKRIEQLSHDIQFRFVYNEFKVWLDSGNDELLYPILLLSKFHFPELDIEQISNRFQAIVLEIEAELTPGLTPLEQVRVIDHILYQENKLTRIFTGNQTPENFLISNLLATRKGNLTILTIFYMIIGQKLSLPMYGLNLPDNFAIAYVNPNSANEHFDKSDVLFYINPGNKGTIFGKNEIDEFIKRIGRQKSDYFYTPLGNYFSLKIYADEILSSYKSNAKDEKAKELARILKLLRR